MQIENGIKEQEWKCGDGQRFEAQDKVKQKKIAANGERYKGTQVDR